MAIQATILNPIEMYKDGALEMNCARMELSQDDAEVPILYRGPGYIQQDEAGYIVFKLFPTETQKHPSAAEHAQVGTAGKLLSADRYFTLVATDGLDRRWVAEKVIPDTEEGVGGLISVGGRVHSISSVSEFPLESFHHTIHFFEEFDYVVAHKYRLYKTSSSGIKMFGSSNDFEELREADFAVSIHKEGGDVTLGLDAVSPFPAQIETRVVEAFQFMLARSLWCRAMRSIIGKQETIRLISPRPASARTRLPPPISLRSVAGHQHLWQLFDLFLQYVLQKSEPGWHTCSIHLHAACEASANSIEAYALGLAVAVEGITNALYPEHAKLHEQYSESVKGFFAYINSVFENIVLLSHADYVEHVVRLHERIAGFQGQLLQVRAVDRMYQLAREGLVDERHIAAWKKLRNTSAHAGAPGASLNQKLIDNILSTVMLMYHMIFNAIGYKGRYIDYSTHGYPPRAYPSREFVPDK